jgi:hypothetical protein
VASEDGLVVVDTGAGSRVDMERRAQRLLDAAREADPAITASDRERVTSD